jgi:hypothetical protein
MTDLLLKNWSEYKDSNLGPPGPKPGALARLRHTPNIVVPVRGNDPRTPTLSRLCSTTELNRRIGGSGEIRTHGALRHDSFQDCCLKPGSATLPKMVPRTGFEPAT